MLGTVPGMSRVLRTYEPLVLLELLFPQSSPWLAQLQNPTVQPLPLRDEEARGRQTCRAVW